MENVATRNRDDLTPEQRKRSYESKYGAGSWKRDHGSGGAEPVATSVTASENTENDATASHELLPTQLDSI